MPLFCLGISHRTAPVELRERFARPPEEIPASLELLRASGIVSEVVWLSTCNRVELYVHATPEAGTELHRWLLRHCGAEDTALADNLYLLTEPASVEHLFRVAAGLDSMVLGETEILGQLKKAYETASRLGHTGARLNRAFQRAFNVAKHLRSTTAIQRGNVSVASVAVELAERLFEKFEGRRALLLGAGETGEKVARAFISRGMGQILIHNRSPERAAALVASLGNQAEACTEWTAHSTQVDVIVSSTSSTGFILDVASLEPVLRARRGRTLLFIDLAVPRDIDPAVTNLPDVYLYNIDDLQMIAAHHLREREAEVAKCLEVIREKARALLGPRPAAMGSIPGTLQSPA